MKSGELVAVTLTNFMQRKSSVSPAKVSTFSRSRGKNLREKAATSREARRFEKKAEKKQTRMKKRQKGEKLFPTEGRMRMTEHFFGKRGYSLGKEEKMRALSCV